MTDNDNSQSAPQVDQWPAVGDVSPSGFCRPCKSFFCPHAWPDGYKDDDPRVAKVRPS
jgi:hypothetical protein